LAASLFLAVKNRSVPRQLYEVPQVVSMRLRRLNCCENETDQTGDIW